MSRSHNHLPIQSWNRMFATHMKSLQESSGLKLQFPKWGGGSFLKWWGVKFNPPKLTTKYHGFGTWERGFKLADFTTDWRIWLLITQRGFSGCIAFEIQLETLLWAIKLRLLYYLHHRTFHVLPRECFPSIRHNGIRDLTAKLLTEVCHDCV